MKKIFSFVWSIPAIVVISATVNCVASDETLLDDTFGSYADDAALDAAWAKVGNAITFLGEDPVNPGVSTLFSKGDRRSRSFTEPAVPTNDEPIYLRVDYFDNFEPGISGREYVGLWASAGAHDGRLLEVGLHNAAESNATDRYTARIWGSEHGTGWFDLNTERVAGWRKIELWVYADTVEIYFDGKLDTIVDWAGGSLGAVRLGFGAGTGDSASQTGVHYKNLLIKQESAPGGQGTLIELSELGPRQEETESAEEYTQLHQVFGIPGGAASCRSAAAGCRCPDQSRIQEIPKTCRRSV